MIKSRFLCCALLLSFVSRLLAQQPTPRLAAAIGEANRKTLPGSRLPFANPSEDRGPLPPETHFANITLVFNRTPEQALALDALLAAQADPSSPQFHQWLTPAQFGERFGLAMEDLDRIQSWVQSQGLTVTSVSPARDRLHLSGTAAAVAAAFGRPLHIYGTGVTAHIAPEGDLLLPSTLAPLVTAVLGLSDLKPEPGAKTLPQPQFTSASSGKHLLTPADVATQYNLGGAYAAGLNGTGQSIAVVGQSWLPPQDLGGLAILLGKGGRSDFVPVLVPNTGVAATYPGSEAEASLDVEYSALLAPGANVFFVYTGDSGTAGAYDALAYTVEQNIAPIISVSFGGCEPTHSAAQINSLMQITQQANAQGQTIVAASGDRGGTECYGSSTLPAAQQSGAAIQFPSDLPTVTAVGGLQLAPTTFDASNATYFSPVSGTQDSYNTLLSYVPEVVWNEDASTTLASGGGGASSIIPRPTWQAGVPGIPSGTFRLVPDIALQASTGSPGFLFCTSDTSFWPSGQTSSCTIPGLPDELTNTYSIAGGTSFGAPILAGMLAVLGQAQRTVGQGNINPVLYSLAAASGTYASVFHDVVIGNNQCTAAASVCSSVGPAGYGAGAGYDLVSGLGSLDFAHLLAAWPAPPNGAKLLTTYINVYSTIPNPTPGSSQTLSIGVIETPYGITTPPTGSVTVALDGQVIQSAVPVASRDATISYTSPVTPGSHIFTVSYSGDSTHAASRGTTAIMIGSAQASGSFQLSATPVSIPYNGTGTTSVTLTPASGYNGLVQLRITGVTTSSTLATSLNFCFRVANASLYAGTTTTSLTLGEGSACTGAAAGNAVVFRPGPGSGIAHSTHPDPSRSSLPVAFASLLVGTLFVRRRSRTLLFLCLPLLVLSVTLSISGCGGGSGTGTPTPPTAPTPAAVQFTVALAGQDSVNATISSTANFSLTVGQ